MDQTTKFLLFFPLSDMNNRALLSVLWAVPPVGRFGKTVKNQKRARAKKINAKKIFFGENPNLFYHPKVHALAKQEDETREALGTRKY